jgi:hypothetical protein
MTILSDPTERRGAIANTANTPADQQAISEVMNQIEQQERPGMVVLYFNGANWMLSVQRTSQWLPRARTG